jgi:hypothetical protein
MHEASTIFRLNPWLRFKMMELPFAKEKAPAGAGAFSFSGIICKRGLEQVCHGESYIFSSC